MADRSTKGRKESNPPKGQLKRGRRKKGSPVPPRNDLTAAKREAFLALLYEGRTVSHAAATVGLARSFVYDLKDRDETFAAEWQEQQRLGLLHRCDVIEDTMFERAINGYEEKHAKDGKVFKTVTKVDNNLLVKLAEAEMPKKYRNNVKVEGEVGVSDDLKALIDAVQNADSSSIDSLVK